jgi:hypothetical protein
VGELVKGVVLRGGVVYLAHYVRCVDPLLVLSFSLTSPAMLSLISALSKFVVTLTPFVVLPFSVVFSVNLALKISIIFLIYHLLVAAIRYFSKGIWVSITIFFLVSMGLQLSTGHNFCNNRTPTLGISSLLCVLPT